MKEEQTYNGWSNYATWRVNLEVIDGWATYHTEDKDYERFEEIYLLADHLKDYAEASVLDEIESDQTGTYSIAASYARAFMDDVDWREIANSLIESYPQLMKSKV